MDFLTNVEMSQALRVAEFAQDEAEAAAIFKDADRLKEIMTRGTEGSLRHLSIIGMDACLMAMIEVQYQVRKFADVMVASQEVRAHARLAVHRDPGKAQPSTHHGRC